MVETMFEGISTDGMFGGGNGEKSLPFAADKRIRQGNGQVRHRRGRRLCNEVHSEMQEVQSQGFIDGTKNKEV